ncbi:3525_t:CDS:10, partial [Entrophospora sp. SA101]
DKIIMDPYRPPAYNQYRPSYERQSFVFPTIQSSYVQQQPARPSYIRPNYRPNYGHMQISGNASQITSTLGSEVEKLTTLFIGGISTGVTDDWMEKILKTCGTLKSWKRVKDQSGNPKGFGFAEYTDADSVLRALRVLGGEGSGDDKKDKGIILPALEEGATNKKLIVKADENTRKYLDQYEASRPRTVEMTKPPQEKPVSPSPVLSQRARDEQLKEHSSHAKERRESRERSYGHHHQPVNFVPARESRRESYILDDEEEEQRRQAKRKIEMEVAFKERERRWQHREEDMAINRERESERELSIREKQIRDRELMARKLAEWDDDIEAERGQEEYYRDRPRWWFHRQQYRARELAMDEQDRHKEQQEVEKRRLELERIIEEEKRQRTEAMETEINFEKDASLTASNGSQNNNIKAKLTLNLSSKRRAAERRKKIKDLVETIPTDKEGLWKWNVKWEELDEAIIEKKLKPFVSKKIVEYFGVQEDELVDNIKNSNSDNKRLDDNVNGMTNNISVENPRQFGSENDTFTRHHSLSSYHGKSTASHTSPKHVEQGQFLQIEIDKITILVNNSVHDFFDNHVDNMTTKAESKDFSELMENMKMERRR